MYCLCCSCRKIVKKQAIALRLCRLSALEKMPRALSVIRCGSRPGVTFSFCLDLDDVMNINFQCMYAFHLSDFLKLFCCWYQCCHAGPYFILTYHILYKLYCLGCVCMVSEFCQKQQILFSSSVALYEYHA